MKKQSVTLQPVLHNTPDLQVLTKEEQNKFYLSLLEAMRSKHKETMRKENINYENSSHLRPLFERQSDRTIH